jgi:hypothetical protein
MGIRLIVALLVSLTGPDDAGADPAFPAISVRAVRPDRECERLLALFEGSKAPHPAAALAGWKRATGGRQSLAKPTEAAIAAFNPGMVRELRNLEGAELCIGFDRTVNGRARWHARLPHDDGTVAALATALVLTDGARDLPIGPVAVDRLGRPGSPLVVRTDRGVTIAGAREELERALQNRTVSFVAPEKMTSGWFARLDPSALQSAGSLDLKRVGVALSKMGCRVMEARASLDADAITVILDGRFAADIRSESKIEPRWLDLLPAERTVAAFAFVVDSNPEMWDVVFAVADGVEKSDPALEKAAPIRTRLNLLALGAQIRPEIDIWPHIRGVSGCIQSSDEGDLEGGLLALHTADAASAERIARVVLPRLRRALQRESPQRQPNGIDESGLGVVNGQPLNVLQRDETVLIAWGARTIEAVRTLQNRPEESVGPVIRAAWGPSAPRRAGAVWPRRVGRLVPAQSPLATALSDLPPVVWSGADEGPRSYDVIRVSGLRAAVHRFLDALPLEDVPASQSD